MTKYENGNLKMPKQGKKTFNVASKNPFSLPKSAKCPECEQITYKVVCPSCHSNLPESTLLMLVSAFWNREGMLNAYRVAVKEKYRFFSFGDAMFIV